MLDSLVIKGVVDSVFLSDTVRVMSNSAQSNGSFTIGNYIAIGSVVITIVIFIVTQCITNHKDNKSRKNGWFMDVIVKNNMDGIKDIFNRIENETITKTQQYIGQGNPPSTNQISSIDSDLDKIYNVHDDIVLLIMAYDQDLGNDVEVKFSELQSLYARTIARANNYDRDNFKEVLHKIHKEVIVTLYNQIKK